MNGATGGGARHRTHPKRSAMRRAERGHPSRRSRAARLRRHAPRPLACHRISLPFSAGRLRTPFAAGRRRSPPFAAVR
ncbi:hypothetical protein AQ810_30000 [Burkholderia pseudomallei]|nr:hypothetical protein AQ810_30000 [Burkholderia pseudomallei]